MTKIKEKVPKKFQKCISEITVENLDVRTLDSGFNYF